MHIVIDIPQKLYKELTTVTVTHAGEVFAQKLIRYIKNGTPLPKGHGDLIDRNEIEYMKAIHDLVWGKITSKECATKIKYSAPTIIKADEVKE